MYISLNNNLHKYNPDLLQSVHSVKQDIIYKILEKDNLFFNTENIVLSFKDKILEDKYTLYHYKISQNDTLTIKLKTKGGGMTANQIISLILAIIGIIFLSSLIVLGVIPFFSFLVSKIFIKFINFSIDFIRGFLDQNNWINNFLAFLKATIIPIIGFLIYYTGLIIIVYGTIFFTVYSIYYFIYKGSCDGFKAAKIVSTVTTFVLVITFIAANITNIMRKIALIFLPGFISGLLTQATNKFNLIKETMLRAVPVTGMFITSFIGLATKLFELMNKGKFNAPKILYEWDKIYKWSKQPDIDLTIRQAKMTKVREGLHAAQKYESGETVGYTPVSRVEFSGFVFMRFIMHTLLYVFIEFIDIFDVCGDKPDTIIGLEQSIKKNQQLMDEIKSQLENPDISNKDKSNMRKSIIELSKTAGKLIKNKEKEEAMKILDIDCLKDILVNGALAGIPTTLVFIIIFIILCFPSMLGNMSGLIN